MENGRYCYIVENKINETNQTNKTIKIIENREWKMEDIVTLINCYTVKDKINQTDETDQIDQTD